MSGNKMKTHIKNVLKVFTLGIGATVMGILLLPAGFLVMLVSVVWRTVDKMICRLEGNDGNAEQS